MNSCVKLLFDHEKHDSIPPDNWNVRIDWVRHAESCSNYYGQNSLDKNKDRNVGFDKLQNESTHEIHLLPKMSFFERMMNHITASFLYHPNLSYIGTQQAIILGHMLRTTYDIANVDTICTSPMVRTIMTALFALRGQNVVVYVVPFISEKLNIMGHMDNQNMFLDSTKLKRMTEYIKKWIAKNWITNFDDIEIMTTIKNLVKHVKQLDEKKMVNILAELSQIVVASDHSQIKREIDNKTLLLEAIRKLLKEISGFDSSNAKHTIRCLCSHIINIIKKMDGPHFDFTILEMYEKDQIDLNPNIEKFYTEIIPKFKQQHKKQNLNIMAFAHGSMMKEHAQKHYNAKTIVHPLNTQIFREYINLDGSDVTYVDMNTQYYVPKLMRSYFENFETINIDVCRMDGLKGILNRQLYDPSKYSNSDKVSYDIQQTGSGRCLYDQIKLAYIALLRAKTEFV